MRGPMSKYTWKWEQAGQVCHPFTTAKRRAARSVKGKLPDGWSYKIMSHDLHYKRMTTWDIKMDYGVPGGPYFTVRWFPCRDDFLGSSQYSVYLWAHSNAFPGDSMGREIVRVLADMPSICLVVDEILTHMIQDPLLQLHAKAERENTQCQPDPTSE